MNRMKRLWIVLGALVAASSNGPLAAKTVYVDAGALGANDGSSWDNACKSLRNALAAAAQGDEIRVAHGIYRPDQGSGVSPGSRSATFQLKTGVAVRGGYAGSGQTDPNARDIVRFETILSGDLKGNDVDVPDPCQLWTEPARLDNAYNVVTSSNADFTTVLDGLTIAAGHESRTGNPRIDGGPGGGGGMVNTGGAPVILQCTFRSNAGRSAGGLLNIGGGPTLVDCTFAGNFAYTEGGALVNNGGTPTIEGCTFSGNVANAGGGAISNRNAGALVLKDCSLTGNASAASGGGIFNDKSSLTADQCILAGNSAAQSGGAVKVGQAADKVVLTFCTLTGNRAPCGSALDANPQATAVGDSILWANSDPDPNKPLCSAGTLSHCCIQGSIPYADGGGNLTSDPLFAKNGFQDPNGLWINGDYHLQSQAGRWDLASTSWVRDKATSPCIDAGNPADPIGSEPFPNGGIVNMGAYGGGPEASKSYFGKAPCQTILAGDVNGDCRVDAQDLAIMAMHWLENRQERVHLEWLRHSGFKAWTSSVVIYFDPYQVTDSPHDATFILISHSHYDHYSPADIARVAGPQTQLIGPTDVVALYGKGLAMLPGQTLKLGDLTVQAVPAYNINKSGHPKANNWVGFVVEIAGKRLYHAGDTDLIEEMKTLKDIDVAMLPVSGVYAMTATEAATATTYIQPKLAIPMHWGTIVGVGTLADAQTFAQKAACPVKIMTVGEIISL